MRGIGIGFILAVFAAPSFAGGASAEPWAKAELITVAELSGWLPAVNSGKVTLIHVGFRPLYAQGHIPGSQYAGPGSKAEGLAALKKLVAKMPRKQEIIIYCGCCPWQDCPNIRPAFRALKQTGFTKLKVLEIPNVLVSDWAAKGYPIVR